MYLYFIVIYPDSLHGAKSETFEQRHEKTGFLPMGKQRRRSASQ